MLDWIKRRVPAAFDLREPDHPEPPKPPPGRVMSGEYRLLYKYLKDRYADTVVLTFAEIEDLLGFRLPDQARLSREWWTNPDTNVAGSNYSDSWILASRTAAPNLSARTVVFEHES
jgi:hypothetical protein